MVWSLALCPRVVSQAPHHLRSSEKQATCEASFARQCICSVISLHSSMAGAVHPQELCIALIDPKRVDRPKEGTTIWPSGKALG